MCCALYLKVDINEVKDTVQSIRNIVLPLAEEIEGEEEMRKIREENEYVDQIQVPLIDRRDIRYRYL